MPIHYIYRITHKSGYFYIGQRTYNGAIVIEDKYIGSGKWITEQLKGNVNFRDECKKEIIEICKDKKELNKKEKYHIRNHIDNPKNMNISISAGGALLGNDNHQYDPTIYFWQHIDGRKETLTQYDMRKKYDLKLSSFNKVVRGHMKSYMGWHCNGDINNMIMNEVEFEKYVLADKSVGTNNPRHDKRIYIWSKQDLNYNMTKLEFILETKLHKSGVYNLANGKIKEFKGWTCKEVSCNSL